MDQQKIDRMLKQGIINKKEYDELKSTNQKSKDKGSGGDLIFNAVLMFLLSPIFTFKALQTWEKAVVLTSIFTFIFALTELFVFRKKCKANGKENPKCFQSYTYDVSKKLDTIKRVLIASFAGLYFFYAIFTVGWYVDYKKYNYIGVDTFKILIALSIFSMIIFLFYLILRINVFKNLFLSLSKSIKENRIIIISMALSILIMCSILIYGVVENKKTTKTNILDLVSYTYVAENDSVKLSCNYHNNTPAEIRKLDRVTVIVKNKSNHKIVKIKTFNSVSFDDWCIKGNNEATIKLPIEYSLEANRNLWEGNNVEVSVSYVIE